MKRFSKKRQSILECLRGTKEHPGADWVFEQLKPVYPHLSLGTVYRNLNQLKDEGLIRSVGIVNGQERFDATVFPHTHAICTRCGRVIDVDQSPVLTGLSEQVKDATGFEVSEAELRFSGLCRDCLKRSEK